MENGEVKEIVQIVSPTDGARIFYNLRNRSIESVKFSKEDASRKGSSGNNDSEENADKQDGTKHFRDEESERSEEETTSEAGTENSEVKQDSENIFRKPEEDNNFLNNW